MNNAIYNLAKNSLNSIPGDKNINFDYDEVVDHVSDACEWLEVETDYQHDPLFRECDEVTKVICKEFNIERPKYKVLLPKQS